MRKGGGVESNYRRDSEHFFYAKTFDFLVNFT